MEKTTETMAIFGTHGASKESILNAAKTGYVWFDTATGYGNSKVIGDVIRENKLNVKIIAKFNPTDFEMSKKDNVDYAILSGGAEEHVKEMQLPDVVMLHSPLETKEQTYAAFMAIQRSFPNSKFGVSNFCISQVKDLLENKCSISFIQLEFSPYYQPLKLIKYCQDNGIYVMGYRIVSKGKVFNDNTIAEFAKEYKVNVCQLLIRWAEQLKIIPVIKSSNVENMKANLHIPSFIISDAHLRVMAAYNKGAPGATCALKQKYTSHDD